MNLLADRFLFLEIEIKLNVSFLFSSILFLHFIIHLLSQVTESTLVPFWRLLWFPCWQVMALNVEFPKLPCSGYLLAYFFSFMSLDMN